MKNQLLMIRRWGVGYGIITWNELPTKYAYGIVNYKDENNP